jgi:hypothetical protein
VGGAGLIQDMGGDSTSPITDTAYPSGATFDKCHAGTALFIANSTNLPGTYVFKGMLMGNDGATVTLELVNLTDAPDTLITSISSNSTTGAFVTSGSIAWAAPGSNKTYGLKAKVDTGSGFAWALSLVRIA